MALTQVSTNGVKDGSLLNADINASAAIAGSKINPAFTSGYVSAIFSANDTDFSDNSAPGAVHGIFTNNSQSTNGVFSALSLSANNSSGTNQAVSFIAQSVSGGTCPNVFITQRTSSHVQTTALSIDTSQNVSIPNGKLGIGTTSPERILHVKGSDCRIRLSDSDVSPDVELQNSSGDGVLATNSTTNLRFNTNNLERLRIDSSGNSHFGSSATISGTDTVSIVPSEGRISYGMDGRTSFVTGENGAYIYSGSGVGGTMPAGDLILQSRSNQNRTIRFVTGSTPTQRMSIDSGGLKFGTDTADANALNDYEEGTWTPALNSGNSLASSTGRYVKIGSMVYAFWNIDMPSNSQSAHLIINNLPFTSINQNPSSGGTARDYQTYDIQDGPIYHVPKNNTQIQFYKNSGQNFTESNGSGLNFRACSIYQAAS